MLMEGPRFLLGTITRSVLRLASHSVSTIAREVVACLKPAGARRGLDIVLTNRVPRDLDSAEMDRELVYIVIFNLVDNAVKYSHRYRDVDVELSVDRAYWVLRVIDEGVHIKEEDYEVIFEPFARKATGPPGHMRPGTGLGLPTAGEIVRAHGGTIDVDSSPAHERPDQQARTVFTVRLPRQIARTR